jgi:ABC-type multidrug transport system fused ATPase/permease subunit
LLGYPEATEDEMINALKKANAYDFLMKHEDGIDLHVGNAGGQLSGGQK